MIIMIALKDFHNDNQFSSKTFVIINYIIIATRIVVVVIALVVLLFYYCYYCVDVVTGVVINGLLFFSLVFCRFSHLLS